jgi:hypothetical protein
MSDTGAFESTVRTLFEGDPASLVEAFNAAADATEEWAEGVQRRL